MQQEPQLGGDSAPQQQGPGAGSAQRSAAQRRHAQRSVAVARLFSRGAVAGGALEARGEQAKMAKEGVARK
eukprot:3523438-Prymnesium_polylepis.1